MPRYFFHVTDGQTYPDHEGTELAGIEAAREEAFGVIGDLLKKKVIQDSHEWRVDITDAAGHSLLTLSFNLHETSHIAALWLPG
jgi:hypothetical protein